MSGGVNVSTKEAMTVPAIAHSSSKPSKVSTLPVTLATGMSDNPNYKSADTLSNEVDLAIYAQPNFQPNLSLKDMLIEIKTKTSLSS